MKKFTLSILLCLATLAIFTSLAYSATPQTATASSEPSMAPVAAVALQQTSSKGSIDSSLVDLMVNLMGNVVEVSLNDSTAMVLDYNLFAFPDSDGDIYQPASNISVGLKFTF